MSDIVLKHLGLTKEQVQSMLGKSTAAFLPKEGETYNWQQRIKKAYEMIQSGGAPDKAAMSWNVPIKAITQYAYDHNLRHPLDYKNNMITCKSYEGYKLAMKVGVSEAARQIGVSRRAIYSFAERYKLKTPLRSL